MQNILTKDDIKFLKELAIELKTQDRQYTAKPVFYQIAEQKKIIGIDLIMQIIKLYVHIMVMSGKENLKKFVIN